MTASLLINVGITKTYKTGTCTTCRCWASFMWYGTAGYIAHAKQSALDAPVEGPDAEDDKQENQTTWPRSSLWRPCSLCDFCVFHPEVLD